MKSFKGIFMSINEILKTKSAIPKMGERGLVVGIRAKYHFQKEEKFRRVLGIEVFRDDGVTCAFFFHQYPVGGYGNTMDFIGCRAEFYEVESFSDQGSEKKTILILRDGDKEMKIEASQN
jgi:hypothetical protein